MNLHNGLVWRGRQLLRPAGHYYRYRPTKDGEPVFVCRCGQRWLPQKEHGTLTRYDRFERYSRVAGPRPAP